jgi:hypothetical protein
MRAGNKNWQSANEAKFFRFPLESLPFSARNLMQRFLFLPSDWAIAGEQPVVATICAHFIN